MSRVGKYAVVVPSGVQVSLTPQNIKLKGKKGELSLNLTNDVVVAHKDNEISVAPNGDSLHSRRMWGTTRANINNMAIGVNEGYAITLDISGVGFRASIQGKNLVMQLGYSHDINYPIPSGVSILCPDQTHIKIEGADKILVGQVAADIRSYRKPEPYKGKGIKYSTETILRKEGKKK